MKLDASLFEAALSAIEVSAKRVTTRKGCTKLQQPSLFGPTPPVTKVWQAVVNQERSFNFGQLDHPKQTRAGS